MPFGSVAGSAAAKLAFADSDWRVGDYLDVIKGIITAGVQIKMEGYKNPKILDLIN